MAKYVGNKLRRPEGAAKVQGTALYIADLEVQGVVRGSISAIPDSSATVRVVEGGCVEGEIHAPKVIVNGQVLGDVHCTEHVELAAKATVDGDVYYKLIEMVKGSQINGKLLYAGTQQKPVAVESLSGKSQAAVS